MAARSNLTWRTFGLAVVGLCLACTHAALAMAPPARTPVQVRKTLPFRIAPQADWVGVGIKRMAAADGQDQVGIERAALSTLAETLLER